MHTCCSRTADTKHPQTNRLENSTPSRGSNPAKRRWDPTLCGTAALALAGLLAAAAWFATGAFMAAPPPASCVRYVPNSVRRAPECCTTCCALQAVRRSAVHLHAATGAAMHASGWESTILSSPPCCLHTRLSSWCTSSGCTRDWYKLLEPLCNTNHPAPTPGMTWRARGAVPVPIRPQPAAQKAAVRADPLLLRRGGTGVPLRGQWQLCARAEAGCS